MIVSEDDVGAALAYLASDPHPIALAKKDLVDAENARKQVYAQSFLNAIGSSVEAKKAVAEISKEYREAVANEASATMEYERHRARVKAADMVCEIYRTECSNVRAAERIR